MSEETPVDGYDTDTNRSEFPINVNLQKGTALGIVPVLMALIPYQISTGQRDESGNLIDNPARGIDRRDVVFSLLGCAKKASGSEKGYDITLRGCEVERFCDTFWEYLQVSELSPEIAEVQKEAMRAFVHLFNKNVKSATGWDYKVREHLSAEVPAQENKLTGLVNAFNRRFKSK